MPDQASFRTSAPLRIDAPGLLRTVIERAKMRSARAQVFALVDQGCLSATTFGTSALLAHTAGLDHLGTFSIVWMIVLLVNAIQSAVVTAPMASLTPAVPEEIPGYHAYYVGAQLQFTARLAIASVGIVVMSVMISRSHVGLVVSALAAVSAYQAFDFVRRFAHAVGRHRHAAIFSAVVSVAQLAALATLRTRGELSVDTALVTIAIVMALFTIIAAVRLVPRPNRSWYRRDLRDRNWESSRWLLWSALMHWTCGNIFILLSPGYVGLHGTGALRAAQSIVGVMNIWFLGLENVIPLQAGKLWRSKSPSAAVRYVARQTVLWTMVTGLFVAAVVVLADPLLVAVYGRQAAEYRWVLEWFAALQLLIFVGLPMRSLLRAAEHTRGIFLAFGAATAFSVVAVVPLLRTLGLAGVLIGLTCAQVVFQSVMALHLWWQFHPISTANGEDRSTACA